MAKLARTKPPAAAPASANKPHNTPQGTGYVSGGLEGIKPPNLGSEVGSSRPVVIRELVPELVSSYGRLITYGKMMNDAGVDMSIRAVKTPVLGAEFFVDPYSSDSLDVEIAEFVEANLIGGMSAPFLNSMEDILHFYEDGFSVLEKVYELREWRPTGSRSGANSKNYTMLKKLGVRHSSTVKEIDYDDNGGPTGIIQSAIKADNSQADVTIDISKLMIFTFGKRGGDLTGKSLLRTAYSHWYYKTHFYKIDAIQKERNSLGVPKGKLLPGYTPQDLIILRQLLRNLRANEEAFIIETPNVEITFEEVHGTLVDVLSSAEHHNTMILLNVMAQFLAAGTSGSGGGGRATAGTQSDLFMKALRYVANYIANVINMYLIPELVVYNYNTKSFPQLKVRNIGETRDLQMLASALSNLFSQAALTADDPTENWLRGIFDMPDLVTLGQTRIKSAAGGGAAATTNTDTQPASTNGKGGIKPNADKTGNVGKPDNAPQ